MPDIVLFGATGYTGRLTAQVLHSRGANFAIAGRDPEKLKRLADEVGSPEIKVADSDDVTSVRDAIAGSKALITCVGPFLDHGWAALEAAVAEKVHYVDSTGEGPFIDTMLERFDAPARDAGIALAPACGFDEAPGDLAVAMACEGITTPDVTVTYAIPSTPSRGTAKSVPRILTSKGPFLRDGEVEWLRAGAEDRWSPLPDPLGPKRAVTFPLALLRLAPLHEQMNSFGTYVSVDNFQWAGLRFAYPFVRVLLSETGAKILNKVIERLPEGPEGSKRDARWTILVEATGPDGRRNVAISGPDVYGLTAEMLSLAATRLALGKTHGSGVIAPVQAMGSAAMKERLESCGVTFGIYDN